VALAPLELVPSLLALDLKGGGQVSELIVSVIGREEQPPFELLLEGAKRARGVDGAVDDVLALLLENEQLGGQLLVARGLIGVG